MAMQKACEATPSTMAAIIALPDEKVEEICTTVNAEGEVCVPANYNCPGQIVISGSVPGIEKACELMKAAGAKRASPIESWWCFPLSVNGSCKSRIGSCYQCNRNPYS